MGNRIVISESQYSRLFLNEQPNKDKVKDLKTKVEKESVELKDKLPDSLDGITFIDKKKFRLPKPQ